MIPAKATQKPSVDGRKQALLTALRDLKKKLAGAMMGGDEDVQPPEKKAVVEAKEADPLTAEPDGPGLTGHDGDDGTGEEEDEEPKDWADELISGKARTMGPKPKVRVMGAMISARPLPKGGKKR